MILSKNIGGLDEKNGFDLDSVEVKLKSSYFTGHSVQHWLLALERKKNDEKGKMKDLHHLLMAYGTLKRILCGILVSREFFWLRNDDDGNYISLAWLDFHLV